MPDPTEFAVRAKEDWVINQPTIHMFQNEQYFTQNPCM